MSNNADVTNDNHGSSDQCNNSDRRDEIHVVKIDEETEEYFKSFPPGYRFCPTDAELILHYLEKKIKNEKLPPHRIQEENLYKFTPDAISGNYLLLYFFFILVCIIVILNFDHICCYYVMIISIHSCIFGKFYFESILVVY